MSSNTFLDTGVVLGFCFLTDKHHYRCKQYLDSNDSSVFYSERVENEYEKKRDELSIRYADAVRDHTSDLRRSQFEDELTPVDIRNIREEVLDEENAASRFLNQYYQQKVQKYLFLDDLIQQLRQISRGIERHALKKKNELDSTTEIWLRVDTYDNLQDALSSIHGTDREICIDAHDLTQEIDGKTELATTNPNDFVKCGHKDMILRETGLSDVISLAVTSS